MTIFDSRQEFKDWLLEKKLEDKPFKRGMGCPLVQFYKSRHNLSIQVDMSASHIILDILKKPVVLPTPIWMSKFIGLVDQDRLWHELTVQDTLKILERV